MGKMSLVSILTTLSVSLYAQMGSGESYGIQFDVSGNVINGVVVVGAEVGPTPHVQMVDQMTTDSQSETLVIVDMMGFESLITNNVASISTSYDATPGAQAHQTLSTVTNGDILVDLLMSGNLLTITATVLSSQASVTGPCGVSGNGDLLESGSTSITNLSVTILGVSVVSNLTGSAFSSTDLSLVSGLDTLGVTGTLILNRVSLMDGGSTGTGSAEAVVLELSLQAGATALGAGNSADIDLTIGYSDASRDCNSVPVELVSFSIE